MLHWCRCCAESQSGVKQGLVDVTDEELRFPPQEAEAVDACIASRVGAIHEAVRGSEHGDFCVDVVKGDDALSGLFVEITGNVAVVTKVREDVGCMRHWNKVSPAGRRVRVGDQIVAVNDVCGDAAKIKDALRDETHLRLRLRRPMRMSVSFVKFGRGLGLVIYEVNSQVELLHIRDIGTGVVAEWNSQNPDMAIQVGDRIVEVNGISADPVEMLSSLKRFDLVRLEVLRLQP
eukprot:2543017-Amphidinium_carterae.1